MSQGDRMAALEWAADYAERNKMFDVPVTPRGYAVGDAKPPTPEQKAAIIIKLADWIMTEEKTT